MNKLQQLIQQYCPDGVEWKTLGEVFDIYAGGDNPKEAFSEIKTEEFCIPILSNGTEGKALYGWTNIAKINKPSLTVSARGTIGWTNICEKPFFPIVRLLVLTPKIKLNIKFSYYFMKTIEDNYSVPTSGIPQLTKPMIKNILIPIPPLPVQTEIVRILDKFSTLTAELQAELQARKSQYEYYRNQLLDYSKGEVEWKTLEEVASFTNGKGHEQNITENGKYIVVNSKFISTNGLVAKFSDKQICPLFRDNILIVMSDLPNGKALAKTFLVEEDDKYTLNQRIGGIKVNDISILSPKFLNYILNRTPQLLKFDDGASQTNLRKDQILGIAIPIPPLAEQERIVSILDKFDTLTNSISEGLPKEIELRQKQYEYYRDMLLTFPQKTA